MIKMDLNINNISKKEIDFISEMFLSGKSIAYPTDTVYGLGCIATSEKAIEKIYKIKKRSKDLPFIILVKSFCMANKYAKISKKQDIYLRSIWPSRTSTEKVIRESEKNPKTVILQSSGLLPKKAIGKDESVAFRLPKNDFLGKILKKVDLPIISSSLNISGKAPLKDIDLIEKYFKDHKPDLLINLGPLPEKKPSSIIDIRDIENIKKTR